MNKYFVVINRHSFRTGELLGKTVCFVEADNEQDAEDKVWELQGGNSSSVYCVFQITEGNNSFTVYN